jgi:hypothetical protein
MRLLPQIPPLHQAPPAPAPLMAVAISNRQEAIRLSGNIKLVLASITLDTSYPTGGSPGITAALGLASILALIPYGNKGGYDIDYVKAADKLKCLYGTGSSLTGPHTEVANTTNLSAVTVDTLVIGT